MITDIERTTFSRSETMRICGITTAKLNYLERNGIIVGIVPNRLGHRPAKRYTFNHLIEIKCLMKLRETLSVQKLCEAKDYMIALGKSGTFHDKFFIVSGDDFQLVERTELTDYAVSLAGRNQGQLSLILIDLDAVICEVKQDGNKVSNFTRRLPLAYQSELMAV